MASRGRSTAGRTSPASLMTGPVHRSNLRLPARDRKSAEPDELRFVRAWCPDDGGVRDPPFVQSAHQFVRVGVSVDNTTVLEGHPGTCVLALDLGHRQPASVTVPHHTLQYPRSSLALRCAHEVSQATFISGFSETRLSAGWVAPGLKLSNVSHGAMGTIVPGQHPSR